MRLVVGPVGRTRLYLLPVLVPGPRLRAGRRPLGHDKLESRGGGREFVETGQPLGRRELFDRYAQEFLRLKSLVSCIAVTGRSPPVVGRSLDQLGCRGAFCGTTTDDR